MVASPLVFAILIAGALIATAFHAKLSDLELKKLAHVNKKLADKINKLGGSFRAAHYSRFENKTKKQLNQFLGARIPAEVEEEIEVEAEQARKRRSTGENVREKRAITVPATFDSRTAFSWCADIIGIVQDQGNCGSCWAVSSASAITDRRCIYTAGADRAQIGAWDLASCCTKCFGDGVSGCNGGYMVYASDFYHSAGIVTGSKNANNYGCKPYPLAPTTPEPASTPCSQTCSATSGLAYSTDKRKRLSPYTRFEYRNNATGVQWDIKTNGPVVAHMDVYEDFYTYKSGVYSHITGSYVGGHAIRLIGWGVENNVPYWLGVNSWGPAWGAAGYFKIRRGSNHVGIESYVVATYP